MTTSRFEVGMRVKMTRKRGDTVYTIEGRISEINYNDGGLRDTIRIETHVLEYIDLWNIEHVSLDLPDEGRPVAFTYRESLYVGAMRNGKGYAIDVLCPSGEVVISHKGLTTGLITWEYIDV